jgi:hypothetical protein
MRGRLGGALTGCALALVMAAPAAAQQWPAYGTYGYGSGYDYQRNAYSYPRPVTAVSDSVPAESLAMYGGYMPTVYYAGAPYGLERAALFPSGQAFCQTAGSYLYCADIESGAVSLLAAGSGGGERPSYSPVPDRPGSTATHSGVLSTRTVGNTSSLVGTLRSAEGTEVAVNCSGTLRTTTVSLSCQ